MKYVGKVISKLAESGNTLVLVDRVKAGEILEENITTQPSSKLSSSSMSH